MMKPIESDKISGLDFKFRTTAEFEIEVAIRGYYDDPGRTWGNPENCYPPDSGYRDIRIFIAGKGYKWELPTSVVDAIEEDLREQIEEQAHDYHQGQIDDYYDRREK